MNTRQIDLLETLPTEIRTHLFSFLDIQALSSGSLTNKHWSFFAKDKLNGIKAEIDKLGREELIERSLVDIRIAKLALDIDLKKSCYKLLVGDLFTIANSHSTVAAFMLKHKELFSHHRFRNADCLTELCTHYLSVAQVVFENNKLYGMLTGSHVREIMNASPESLAEVFKNPTLLKRMKGTDLNNIAEIIQSPQQAIAILSDPKLSEIIYKSDLLALGIKFVEAALEIIANRNEFDGDFYLALGMAHIEATQKILKNLDILNKIPMCDKEKPEEKAFDFAIYASFRM